MQRIRIGSSMQDTKRSPLTTYSFERARALMQAAWDAYQLGQCGRASELYAQALQISEALDWTEGIVYCRTWGAMSLDASGQSRQALATLAPLFQVEPR